MRIRKADYARGRLQLTGAAMLAMMCCIVTACSDDGVGVEDVATSTTEPVPTQQATSARLAAARRGRLFTISSPS